MSFSALVGVALTLAFVLGLLAVTMRLLRKVSQGGAMGRGKGGITLEVVQRVTLGPRQGIAVVRIGEQLVAVSVGDGGVRTLAELDAAEATVPANSQLHAPQRGPVSSGDPAMAGAAGGRDFRSALMHGLRSAGLPLLLLATVATALPLLPLTAQATRPAPQAQGTRPATPAPGPRASQPTTAQSASAAPAQGTTPPGATAQAATPPRPAAGGASSSLDDALGKAIPQLDLMVDGSRPGGLRLSGSVGIVILMGLLTLLPTLVLMMTSFTRILIVLQFLKQALGTQTAPPGQLVGALALLLTGFVMAPTMREVNRVAITPWLDGQIEQGAMMQNALGPMRDFMLRQVRERDITAFLEMSGGPAPERPEDVSTLVLTSAFVTSELRTAFQLGFVLFLPFIIIDIVVASVLMSMGMFMLPPAMIALPFKLLLFVLVDGWTLLIQSLVQGFK